MKKLILATVEDLVANFIYYDRKEDEELPRGAIEEAAASVGPILIYQSGQLIYTITENRIKYTKAGTIINLEPQCIK